MCKRLKNTNEIKPTFPLSSDTVVFFFLFRYSEMISIVNDSKNNHIEMVCRGLPLCFTLISQSNANVCFRIMRSLYSQW